MAHKQTAGNGPQASQGGSREKQRRMGCCSSRIWSWLILFFAIVGASDYFKVLSTYLSAYGLFRWCYGNLLPTQVLPVLPIGTAACQASLRGVAPR